MNSIGHLIPRKGQLRDTMMNITNRGCNRDTHMTTGRQVMMNMDINTERRVDRRNPVKLDQVRDKGSAVMFPTIPINLQPVAGSPVDIITEKVVKNCHLISSGDDSYQPLVTGPVGANVSQTGRYPGRPRSTEYSVGRNAFTRSRVQDVSPDNSYQSLNTSPGGANVSEDGNATVIQRNTDNFVGRTGFTQQIQFDVSPDNSYQSSVTSQEGANVSEDDMDTVISQNTDDSVGRTDFFQKYESVVSPDNSYQSSVTSQVGTNVSVRGPDSGRPRNTDNSVGVDDFKKKASALSPDNSYQSLLTSPGGANVSADGRDTVQQQNTDRSVGLTGFLKKDGLDVSLDNSYQSSVTSQVGANVSGGDADPGLPQNTDDSVGRTGFLQKNGSDVSLDNSYQSSVTSQVGANVSGGDSNPGLPQNTDDFVGRTGFLQKDGSDVSLDNSYQSSVTSQVGANVSGDDSDPGLPRNTDDSGGEDVDTLIPQNTNISVGQTGFLQKDESEGSPDNSYQSSVTSRAGAIVTGEKNDIRKPWNTEKNSIGVIRFTHTKPSDVVIMKIYDTDREECEGSIISEGEQPLYMRKMDPVPKWTGFTPSKPSDVVYMNIDYDDLPELEQKSQSSDSGIHSYDDNCTSLSTGSLNSDVVPGPEDTRTFDASLAQERLIPVRQISSHFHQAVVTELEVNIQESASVVNLNGYHSDVADLADFSDEEVEPWEDEDTYVANQPVTPVVIVPQFRVSVSSTNGDGSDVADMDDFSDDEDDDILPSYYYAILHKIPPIMVCPDEDSEQSRTWKRELPEMWARAVKLDDITLRDSDLPKFLKDWSYRFRWIKMVKEERAVELNTGWKEEDNRYWRVIGPVMMTHLISVIARRVTPNRIHGRQCMCRKYPLFGTVTILMTLSGRH